MEESERREPGKTPVADILKNLENLAKGLSVIINGTNNSITVNKTNLAFKIVTVDLSVFSVIARKDLGHAFISTINSITNEKSLASLKAENLTGFGTKSLIYTYFFTKPTLFQGKRKSNNGNISTTVIGTNILAVTISSFETDSTLKNPINITFQKRTVGTNLKITEKVCSFWNVSSGKIFLPFNRIVSG